MALPKRMLRLLTLKPRPGLCLVREANGPRSATTGEVVTVLDDIQPVAWWPDAGVSDMVTNVSVRLLFLSVVTRQLGRADGPSPACLHAFGAFGLIYPTVPTSCWSRS
jgi:hypothetical protein